MKQDKVRQENYYTCSSTLVGSSITYPLSVRQQHIATAETSKEGEKEKAIPIHQEAKIGEY